MNGRYLAAGAAVLAVGGACDFPPVPRSAGPGIEKQARIEPVPGPDVRTAYETGEELPDEARLQAEAEPVEIRGMVASNAVSSLVIQVDGSHRTVQMTPETQLRIGDRVVGLREIQPGTEVRATYLPVGANLNLAVEVAADPATVGWSGRGNLAEP